MTVEDRRQLVHASMTLWVVALRWTTPFQAALLAAAAVVFNWVVMPLARWDRGVRREGAAWIDGVKLYPVAVLAAVLLFPLPAAAAGWAVMGLGDAASNVAGRRLGRPGFLGRPDRSLAGTVAFVLVAAPAAGAAYAWAAGAAPTPSVALAAAAAAAAGAVVELLVPRGFDDNLAICLAASGVVAALV
jgi:dolichol kinase